MKLPKLFAVILLMAITCTTAYAFPQTKTCTCYTGWQCYPNQDGSIHCASSGFSWAQNAALACNKTNFINGSYANYSAYSSGPGQAYNTTVIDSGSIGDASEIIC